jgi:hypothetical protein
VCDHISTWYRSSLLLSFRSLRGASQVAADAPYGAMRRSVVDTAAMLLLLCNSQRLRRLHKEKKCATRTTLPRGPFLWYISLFATRAGRIFDSTRACKVGRTTTFSKHSWTGPTLRVSDELVASTTWHCFGAKLSFKTRIRDDPG